MGGERILWDLDNIKQRLLNGDMVKAIAEDEGLTLTQLSSKFRYEVGRYPRTWALQEKPELSEIRSFRVPHSLPVNEHYFDDFHKKPARHAAYLFGILYGRPVTSVKNRFWFASKNETLIDIMQTELEAKHELLDQGEGCYMLRIDGVPHLYQTLCSLGVEGSVRERSFPDISESVLSDFMRGIVEANSGVSKWNKVGTRLDFYRFGLSFVQTMNDILTQYAGVSRDNPTSYRFSYRGENIPRIANFIYQNKEYLEDTGLFVPEIREKLEGN